jgi:hypothetical protein
VRFEWDEEKNGSNIIAAALEPDCPRTSDWRIRPPESKVSTLDIGSRVKDFRKLQ